MFLSFTNVIGRPEGPRSQEVYRGGISLAIVLHPIIMVYSVSQVPTLLTLSAGAGVKAYLSPGWPIPAYYRARESSIQKGDK